MQDPEHASDDLDHSRAGYYDGYRRTGCCFRTVAQIQNGKLRSLVQGENVFDAGGTTTQFEKLNLAKRVTTANLANNRYRKKVSVEQMSS